MVSSYTFDVADPRDYRSGVTPALRNRHSRGQTALVTFVNARFETVHLWMCHSLRIITRIVGARSAASDLTIELIVQGLRHRSVPAIGVIQPRSFFPWNFYLHILRQVFLPESNECFFFPLFPSPGKSNVSTIITNRTINNGQVRYSTRALKLLFIYVHFTAQTNPSPNFADIRAGKRQFSENENIIPFANKAEFCNIIPHARMCIELLNSSSLIIRTRRHRRMQMADLAVILPRWMSDRISPKVSDYAWVITRLKH